MGGKVLILSLKSRGVALSFQARAARERKNSLINDVTGELANLIASKKLKKPYIFGTSNKN